MHEERGKRLDVKGGRKREGMIRERRKTWFETDASE